MKKIIFIVILLLLSLQTKTNVYAAEKAAGSSAVLVSIHTGESKDDRALILGKFLSLYNSPMAENAGDFVRIADKYNLDWKMVPAIAGVESYFGQKIPYNSYNAWGWGVYGSNVIRFSSWENGIETVSQGLRTRYMDKWGAQTAFDIGRYYAADPRWAYKVSYFISAIEKFEKEQKGFAGTLPISI